ncbi:hypothetical protein BT96DRAFT_608778 [Gymnopus androsaceus JB14]|uniref:Uncharacterized protein n=1 Tax=Gymnopus androsaceus JB14 TaxID=1447944 RepID=A0A6A4HTK0_9AGAR|nr:hypothetical protein BT96DRAFT_608778 [Gymnopus androsaceus JB14]
MEPYRPSSKESSQTGSRRERFFLPGRCLVVIARYTLYTKSLYMASYPPEVLSPFLQRLTFSALHQVTIHGYDPRVSKAPASVTLFKAASNESYRPHLESCVPFRMNAIAFLELLSQAELHELQHCTLDNINTTIDDSWDDYLSNPSSGSVDNFLVKRSQEKSAARSPLTSLYLNRVTNLPNTAFNKALFGHPHSLFDISTLENLTLCIASYPPVPLWHFNEVIGLCCPSVKSLTIRNWQDVAHSDASLLTKFNNVTHIAFDFYGGTGLGGLKASMELALEHLAQLKSLKKLNFTIESYRKLGSLVLGLEEGLDALCHEVTGIEEIVISVKSLSSENYDREEVFVWDRERCLLSTEVL